MNQDRRYGRNSNEGQPLLRAGETMVGPQDMKGFTLARVYRSAATDETPEAYLLLVNSEIRSNPDGTTYMRATHAGDLQKNAIPLSMLDIDALTSTLIKAKAQLLKDQDAYHERRRLAESARLKDLPRTELEQAWDKMESTCARDERQREEELALSPKIYGNGNQAVAEAIGKSLEDFEW